MPADNNMDNYKLIMSDLQALLSYYSTCGNILVAGDFNGQLQKDIKNNPVSGCAFKTMILTEFVEQNNLIATNKLNITSGPQYSYKPTKAMIDHIFIETSMVNKLCNSFVFNDEDIFTSDHLPIFLQFSINECTFNLASKTSIAWNKCTCDHISAYQNQLSDILNASIIDTKSDDVDEINEIITKGIHKAAKIFPKSNFNKHTKPYWSAEIKNKHYQSRCLRRKWISEGRPRGRMSQSYNEYKIAKNDFRRLQRYEANEYVNKKNEELEHAAEVDYRLFWRILRGRKPKQKLTCTEIIFNEKTYKDENIANGFGEYYAQVFNEPPDKNTSFSEDILKKLEYFKQKDLTEFKQILESEITVQEILLVIEKLKKRKSPGVDQILNEHIIYGGDRLNTTICLLFNSILSSERIPEQWKTSIIIPLFKGNGKNKTLPNSYRPISLLSCLYKIFEKVLLERCQSFIRATGRQFPCPQQQGFQKGLSCITASFNLHESIYSQIEQNSKTYVAYLDIKGAYDYVWHNGLFTKVAELGITGKLLRVLTNSYTRLKCSIRINGQTSTSVDVKRGVRPGGVL